MPRPTKRRALLDLMAKPMEERAPLDNGSGDERMYNTELDFYSARLLRGSYRDFPRGLRYEIADSQVEAKIDFVTGQANLEIYEGLQRDLNNRFLAAQLLTHRAYELSSPNRGPGFRQYLCARASLGQRCGLSITDKDGMVVTDSRRQRIERKRHFADLVASHPPTDKLLDSLLQSYHAAVNDPDDELVHLYQFVLLSPIISVGKQPPARRRVSLSLNGIAWGAFVMTNRYGKGATEAGPAGRFEMHPKPNWRRRAVSRSA